MPGAKNSVLKLMAASLLGDGTFEITNVPGIVDVGIMADLLRAIGVAVTETPEYGVVTIDERRRPDAGGADCELVEGFGRRSTYWVRC